ncbi:hypothetical protein [Nocardia vaccinii]|uniref:hypothetical protein n=1 Tax=Nocardia vaccinii TaxID=1822 RepID=UPI0008306368|nr:hypothetical protein [Nocardia vaccinii]
MTEPDAVTVADTVRWLHEEGLMRLASVADRIPNPVCAYTVDVATGTVTVFPATGAGLGADVVTLAADDLPAPNGPPKRLVIVGVTTSETVLIVDLAASRDISIDADRPEAAARSWVLQLLLNPEITLTTNSAEVTIADSPRLRHSFIPGGRRLINVDDRHPPVTVITLNSAAEGTDHLEVDPDDSGEMYLGARRWPLRQVLTMDDSAWKELSGRLSAPAESAFGPSVSTPAEHALATGADTRR